jgi:hypothetical protein
VVVLGILRVLEVQVTIAVYQASRLLQVAVVVVEKMDTDHRLHSTEFPEDLEGVGHVDNSLDL